MDPYVTYIECLDAVSSARDPYPMDVCKIHRSQVCVCDLLDSHLLTFTEFSHIDFEKDNICF